MSASSGILIDAARRLRPINPLIYGLAGGSDALHQQIQATLVRWGGNPASRYNWQLGNAWNAARDWEFRNGNYGNIAADDRLPSGVADKSIAAARALGAASLVTIPALGWVARDDKNESRSLDVPKGGGLPLAGSVVGAIAGYDPSANRARTSVPSLARALAGAPASAVVQDAWVRHLVRRFGDATHGGVRYYAVDNEPDLWDITHTDVHPARMGYETMLATFLDYATAIKDADPTAQVTGPVLSGWTGMYYSSLDRGADNFATAADRAAHGGAPFVTWWLQQVKAHDEQTGRRTLDVLDVHYYPQGGEYQPGGNDTATNQRRLRSTRSLWDPTFIDESWIAKTYDEDSVRGIVRLVPRLREWVTKLYPGTKIGVTEWNWGAEDTPNGALAIAEVLGIFGREGVDLAAYWTAPKERSPGALAFQAYRNYDGKGAAFGDIALSVGVTDPDRLSCFASASSATGDLVAVVLNKQESETLDARVRLANFASDTTVQQFRYAGSDEPVIKPLPDARVQAGSLALKLPPASLTVLRFARG